MLVLRYQEFFIARVFYISGRYFSRLMHHFQAHIILILLYTLFKTAQLFCYIIQGVIAESFTNINIIKLHILISLFSWQIQTFHRNSAGTCFLVQNPHPFINTHLSLPSKYWRRVVILREATVILMQTFNSHFAVFSGEIKIVWISTFSRQPRCQSQHFFLTFCNGSIWIARFPSNAFVWYSSSSFLQAFFIW